jgi:peptide/nickel transport system permease protein
LSTEMARSLIALSAIIVMLFIIPLLWPSDPMLTDLESQAQFPSATHPLGTDLLGRDVLSRTLYGGQRTLASAGLSTLMAIIPGMTIGLLMGWYRGQIDHLIMILINAILAFPGLLFALVIMTLMGQGVLPMILAVGLAQIAPYSLITRTAVISIRSMAYIEVAEALGASRWHIIIQHILPNIAPTLLAYLGVTFAYSILNGTSLSFLGLAGEPGIPDWGGMLAEGRYAFRVAPWVGLVPGIAITITVISVNNLVDSLASFNRW